MFSCLRRKKTKEHVPAASNDKVEWNKPSEQVPVISNTRVDGPDISPSKSQEQVEMCGKWTVAKSYDALQQWIQLDKSKFIVFKFDLTKDQAQNLFETLESNTTLLSLVLQNQSSGDFLCLLASTLQQNNITLQSLLLRKSNISNEGVGVLAESWANNPTRLKQLGLTGNAIGDIGVTALVDVLRTNTCLRCLNLSNTGCGDEAMEALGEGMSHFSTLDELWLDNNKIGDVGAKDLLSGMLNNWSLTSLNLDNNANISEGLLVQIKNRVKENTQWQRYKCSKTEIGSFLMHKNKHDEAYLLYKEGYTTLDQVEHISNQMVPFGLESRSDVLEIKRLIKEESSSNPSKSPADPKSSDSTVRTEPKGKVASSRDILSPKTQEQVKMENEFAIATSHDKLLQWIQDDTYKCIVYKSSLTMEQARILFDVLMMNQSLSSLCLHSQSLGDYICRLASTFLQSNGMLVGLLLPQSSISYDGADLIASALVNNRARLKVLSFEGCAIGNQGILALVKVLKINTQLRKLDLTNTDCGDDAARELAKAMLFGSTLDELRLGYNRISDAGAQELLEGLSENLSTVKLDLEGNNNISVDFIVKIGKRCKEIKELQLSKCSQTELGSFLISEDMTDEAYCLYKEGFRTFNEIEMASEQTLLAVYGITYDSLKMVKDKVGKPSYFKSPMGVFLIKNGYEKYCKIVFENGKKEVRALDDSDLKNVGVTDEHDRGKLIKLLKDAVPLAGDDTIKDTNISTTYAAFVCHDIKDSAHATSVFSYIFKANHPEVKELYLPERGRSQDDFLPQVRLSPVFLVLLSKGFFSSKWCIAELIEAFEHKKPFVAVRVIDEKEATFERDEFQTLCNTCPVLSNMDSREFLRLKGLLKTGVFALRALSKMLLIDFDLDHLRKSEIVLLNARVAQIKKSLHEQAKPPGCIYRSTGQSK